MVRHAAIAWLLAIELVSLALTLDRALPRMPSFGVTAWTVVAMRIVLAGVGIAVAGRLRARDDGAWRAVALWACASIGATLLERLWPELPGNFAPSRRASLPSPRSCVTPRSRWSPRGSHAPTQLSPPTRPTGRDSG